MVYKVNLNSNNYFSTTNINTTSNRTYGIDWSFLPEGKKYKMTHNFSSDYSYSITNYPPALLSSTVDTTTLSGQPYGNGTYAVSCSSQQGGREARNLFDGGGAWRPLTTNNIGGWVQLELPSAIVLASYQVNTNTGTAGGVPTSFKLEGSNDNFATSVLLSQVSWGINQGSRRIIINPPVNQGFKYFRLTNLAGGYGTSFIQYLYPLLFFEATPIYPSIISINTSSFPSNFKASSKTDKKATNLAGVLKNKGYSLYSNPNHNEPIVLHSRPSSNFITVDLYNFDEVLLTSNIPYIMSLFFEEIE